MTGRTPLRSAIGALGLTIYQAAATYGQLPPTVSPAVRIQLKIPEGTPLRLYIKKRVWFREGAPVTAVLIEPLWAFDQVVVPAGTSAEGHIAELKRIPKMARATALLNGDFTPLKLAAVTFTSLTFPDGTTRAIAAAPSLGLLTTYSPTGKAAKAGGKKAVNSQSTGARMKRQINNQIAAYTAPVVEVVKGKNKLEWAEEFLLSKLPFHPQWYRSRTRFDAELRQPLDFGMVSWPQNDLAPLESLCGSDRVAQVRLLSPITSADARRGDVVEAILSEPIYFSDKALVFREGTKLAGKVTMSQRARYFHRGGKVRFSFEQIRPPQIAGIPGTAFAQSIQGQLAAAEADPASLKVDGEGTAVARDSKTRFLKTGIAGLIAANAADPGGESTAGVAATSSEVGNVGGRALGGFSGFGLIGTALSFGPRAIGVALGYYGLAWSAYSNIVARGTETTFKRNGAIKVRLSGPGTARGQRFGPTK